VIAEQSTARREMEREREWERLTIVIQMALSPTTIIDADRTDHSSGDVSNSKHPAAGYWPR
jgi:hypothetical protein